MLKKLNKKVMIVIGIVIVIVICCIVGWFMLRKSNNYQVKITDGNDVMVSGSNISITKQDYFEVLLDQYGANEVLNEVIDIIAEQELEQDDIDEAIEEMTETYSLYTGDLETYAQNLGYETKQDYIDEIIAPAAKQELLREKYLNENLESYIQEYQVTSFKQIIVDKESTALSIIKEVESEDDFDALMEEYDDSEDAGLVTKNTTTLDENLLSALEELSAIEEDGVYSEAIKLSDDTYAVIYLYNTDHSNTDEIVQSLSSDSEIQEEVEAIYLKKYNFDVHDKKLKSLISEFSDQYFE